MKGRLDARACSGSNVLGERETDAHNEKSDRNRNSSRDIGRPTTRVSNVATHICLREHSESSGARAAKHSCQRGLPTRSDQQQSHEDAQEHAGGWEHQERDCR